MERQTFKPEATFSSTSAGPSGALGARGGRGVDRGGRSPIPGDSAGVHRVGTVRQTRGQLRPPGLGGTRELRRCGSACSWHGDCEDEDSDSNSGRQGEGLEWRRRGGAVKVSLRNGSAWARAIMIGSLSSWLIGTSVMVAAMLIHSVLGTGSLDNLIFVVVLVPIIAALLFPGALVAGGAAGCLALRTARSMSPRAHAAGFFLFGAVVGVVYARVLLSSHSEIEVENPSLLLGEAGISGAAAGAVMSILVRKRIKVARRP